MKLTTSLLLPVAVSAAVIESRQASKQSYTFETKNLQAQLRATTKRTLTRVGPLNLVPGLSGRHGMTLDSNGQGMNLNFPKGTFCDGECTVISGKAGLEFENGTQADVSKGVYIHHILTTNLGKKVDPFVARCDTQGDIKTVQRPGKAQAGFVGVSDDNGNEPIIYGTKDGSIEGGYFVSNGDSFRVWADLVNLDAIEKQVYLTYDLEYLPGHVGADAQGSLISVTGCAGRRINTSAAGATNTTSGNFRFFRDGQLVNGKGHLHDGGVAMDLLINGQYICSSDAIYGGETGTRAQEDGQVWQTVSGMTICPGPIKIKDGDYMALVSRYDLSKHPLRMNGDHKMAEVMGMWTMNFIPDKPSQPSGAAEASLEVSVEASDEDVDID